MASQSTIDLINDAIAVSGQQLDLSLRGNAHRPNHADIKTLGARVRIICRMLDSVCADYDIETSFLDWAEDIDFEREGELADERLRAPRGLRCLIDEDYGR